LNGFPQRSVVNSDRVEAITPRAVPLNRRQAPAAYDYDKDSEPSSRRCESAARRRVVRADRTFFL